MRVFSEKDKVILELGRRGNSFLISCSDALDIAANLDFHAGYAEKEPKSLIKGEVWDVKVESFDGQVGFHFTPPYQKVGNPSIVPMPPNVARSVARLIRDKESWARHKMRLVLQRSR